MHARTYTRTHTHKCSVLPSLGDSQDPLYPRPRDLDLIQSTPLESLALKTPPRVLTLNDRPLDFLERSAGLAQTGEEVGGAGRQISATLAKP